ncbi:efflux RND transporter periplasmic adaptor subunit [Thermogutta sp.]|uniref:efflux RND transporter periplasmic adaptor subunit n=1 Tax=Thermogutta sp. TaxID=1962930 RepID=UPI003C7BE76E
MPDTAMPAESRGKLIRQWASRATQGILHVLVLGGLAALGIWGHETGWQFRPARHHQPNVRRDAETSRVQVHWMPREVLVAKYCATHAIYFCPCANSSGNSHDRKTDSPREQGHSGLAIAQTDTSGIRTEPPAWVGAVLQFGLRDRAKGQAVTTEMVIPQPVREVVHGYGRFSFFPADQAELRTPLFGTVWRRQKNPYEWVDAGEIIALIDSPELVALKGEYLQAWIERKAAKQKLESLAQAPVSEQEKQLAAAELTEATLHLRAAAETLISYGLPRPEPSPDAEDWTRVREVLRSLGLEDCWGKLGDSLPASLLPLRAPFSGVVVDIPPTEGQVVEQNALVCRLVNPVRLLLVLSLKGEDAVRVRPGQRAIVRAEGVPTLGEGTVVWVEPVDDPVRAHVSVHLEVKNQQKLLKAGAWGEAEIIVGETSHVLTVPKAALHRDGATWSVFVVDNESATPPTGPRFQARMVRIGNLRGDRYEIVAGLLPGERVVVQGSDVLWNELCRALSSRPHQDGENREHLATGQVD